MLWRLIRRYFITGIFVLLPVIITGYILVFAFKLVDGILRNLIEYYIGRPVPGLGFLIMLALVFLAGLFGTNVVGRKLLALGEEILRRIPVVKSIYTVAKQVMEAVTMQQRGVFRHAVLVEYPRRDIYSIGFITGEAPAEISREAGEDLLNVFMPASPPTQGVLIMVPRKDVRILEMSVEDGLKLLLSGGIVAPPSYQKRARDFGGEDIPVYRRQTFHSG
ncbi:MAG TPA: DUF502 domain-containing protein [Syntrophomonadaceae bacterium]|nr:DUF502 domain-containing protein [Syntrophomonadaceae bacterium]